MLMEYKTDSTWQIGPRKRTPEMRIHRFWKWIGLISVISLSLYIRTGLGKDLATEIQSPAWAAPHIPTRPMPAHPANGVILRISADQHSVTGEEVRLKITITNRTVRPLFIGRGDSFPSWSIFPGTWCWGPENLSPASLLRFVGATFRSPSPGSAVREGISPNQSYSADPIDFSHIFDLSVPGKYEAQLAGMGMVSNVIKFQVLPPNNKPPGPAITRYPGKAPRFTTVWGGIHGGLQIAAYVKFDPNGNRTIRVHLFFRNVAHSARTIRLTGNPELDFAHCRTVGPCFGNSAHLGPLYRRINNQPVPLTAYGKRIAKEHSGHLRWHTYTLGVGKLYEYWRPLLLNRRYDLSVPGPYKFSTRLANTRLHTGVMTIYVGVQPRAYNMPLFNRWLAAWKKKHGVR